MRIQRVFCLGAFALWGALSPLAAESFSVSAPLLRLDVGFAASQTLPDSANPDSWGSHFGLLCELRYTFNETTSIGASLQLAGANAVNLPSPIAWNQTDKVFWRLGYGPIGVRLATGCVAGQGGAGALLGGQIDIWQGWIAVDQVLGTAAYTSFEIGWRFFRAAEW